MKNKVAIFALFMSFAIATPLYASVSISEIMYDLEGSDTGREWIEIKNDSPEAIDFSTFKLFEADANHGLTLVEGDKNIPSGGYAVIVTDSAKFKSDNPNFSGIIFDSSFSLSNEGETLAIKNADLNQVDEFSYTSSLGATGDGKSLQKVSGAWVAGAPTPGKENGVPSQNTNTDTANNTEQTTNTNSAGGSSSVPPKKQNKILLEIISPTSVFTGLPFEITFRVTGLYGEALNHGKLYLNFGNGVAKEIKPSTNTITHTYKYAGEYTVRAEYFANEYNPTSDAKDEIKVSARPATVVISSVGNSADFFVEVKNIASYDIDISGWVLAGANSFVFPKNTILLAGASILLGPEVTFLNEGDKSALRLISPVGNIVFDYGATMPMFKGSAPNKTYNNSIEGGVYTKAENPTPLGSLALVSNNNPELGTEIKGEALVAEVLSTRGQVDSFYLWLVGLVLLIGLGVGLVFFIRTNTQGKAEGDDFEILEG